MRQQDVHGSSNTNSLLNLRIIPSGCHKLIITFSPAASVKVSVLPRVLHDDEVPMVHIRDKYTPVPESYRRLERLVFT